ncbi:MAG TPA: ABC transporter substrate-binding protein [Candidatus Limnocylindrales bacterium]|nr:ABC transporter substrate-binding protein [Candidatus Limnocylindrales bacterium]
MGTSTIRRRLLVLGTGLAVVLAACGGGAATPSAGGASPSTGGGASPSASAAVPSGPITMLSSQFGPIEEQEKMRNEVLANFEGDVEFVAFAETAQFQDRLRAETQAGSGDISLLGALHGDFVPLVEDGILTDLSDVATELASLGISEDYLELGKLGTDQQLYIPWVQATYIMVARNEALQYLPASADINDLTWQQLTDWGAAITAATGERKLGFPAGEDGLLHRLFQGHLYPAFTGGVNTTFGTAAGAAMWTWMRDTWQYVNPQSTTYGFMQEPLQSGEVWVAWDHVARLIDALKASPNDFTAFPVPEGPEGRAFMPVLAGLAIPSWAPNPEGGKALIRYLLQPDVQAATLSAVAFFPVLTGELPGDLEPGIAAEQAAVAAQLGSDNALPALLPIGLGDQGGAYNQVFKDAFQQIVVQNQDVTTVLGSQSTALQGVLDTAGAACWFPDPESTGTCQVGR